MSSALVRRLTIASITGVLSIGVFSAPTLASYSATSNSKSTCNAGRGNGDELASSRCVGGDPGKSFAANNQGGDEVPVAVVN